MELFPGEPAYGGWRAEPIASVLGTARLVAVDGRSGGGRPPPRPGSRAPCRARRSCAPTTSPGTRPASTGPTCCGPACWSWSGPGARVSWTPPAWPRHGRTGSIDVPAGCPLVLVEGVGVSRRALAGWFDLRLWVQSDRAEAYARGTERDAATGPAADCAAWAAEEVPFLAADRPWERADVVLAGRGEIPYDPVRELIVAGRRMGA